MPSASNSTSIGHPAGSNAPSAVYSDRGWFELQRERILARAWHLVADGDSVRIPDSVCRSRCSENVLTSHFCSLAMRTTSCAFSRTSARIAACSSARRDGSERLALPYHGRRFGLDGRFRSMPEFTGRMVSPRRDDLPRVPWPPGETAVHGMDPAPRSSGSSRRSRPASAGCLSRAWCSIPTAAAITSCRRTGRSISTTIWKFPHPFLHQALAGALDYGSYRTELFDLGSVQIGWPARARTLEPRLLPRTTDSESAATTSGSPGDDVNVYPWGSR